MYVELPSRKAPRLSTPSPSSREFSASTYLLYIDGLEERPNAGGRFFRTTDEQADLALIFSDLTAPIGGSNTTAAATCYWLPTPARGVVYIAAPSSAGCFVPAPPDPITRSYLPRFLPAVPVPSPYLTPATARKREKKKDRYK